MALDNNVTVIGQLTADPELRHTKKNIPVASFTIAHNDRIFDKESEEWVDGEPTFVRCSYWREAGENFAESNEKGGRVFVVGKLKQNNFTDKDGNERSSIELIVEEGGPSNKFATTTATRRKGNGNRAGAKPKAKATASVAAETGDGGSDDDFDF
ncbi:single-stranded DNA-binding protein [Brachybacterium atlanticum]|uniref:single-stranded DNA-binding protein n=1 Tax=Brachybacterium atlanticum TaxID=2911888 RepID=UPI0021E030D3|nr:single-stranded DNA-binding protein [Brachybacterium atlanticum]